MGRRGLDSISLNVNSFLLSPSRYPAFTFFNESIAKSFTAFTSFSNTCFHRTAEALACANIGIGRGLTQDKMYNLECIEIRKRSARVGQF